MLAMALVGLVLVGVPPAEKPQLRRPPKVMMEVPCTSLRLPQVKDRLPYGPGESLAYVATINGVRAGNASLLFQEKSTHDGHLVYPAEVKAEANPVVQLWGRMQAELVTVLDPDLGMPLHMKSATHQDKNLYEEDIAFTPGSATVAAQTSINQKPLTQSLAVESDAVDVLSVVYYARSRQFEVGQKFCVDLYQSRLIWRVRGTVARREMVDTDAGPFDAYLATGVAVAQLSPSQKGAPPIIKEPRPFSVWMTADEDRIPVLLKAPTPLGEVVVKLTRFEQGRRLTRAR
jgi:hypothetical protein